MRFFGPKHTPASVAADLIRGREDGSVVLDRAAHEVVTPDRVVNDFARLMAPLAQTERANLIERVLERVKQFERS